MNKSPFRILTCTLLLCMMVIGFTTTAMAAPSLQWQTDCVYYDNQGRIVIDGYFYNDGSRTITWINSYNVRVFFKQHNTKWWQQASATFRDLNVYIEPGDTLHWTFQIYNVQYAYFDYWDVKWQTNYNYE